MRAFEVILAGVIGSGCFACASSGVDAKEPPSSQPVIEMSWGSLDVPGDTGGFGMHVALFADGRLSCHYAFAEVYMGFAGVTSSVGSVSPGTIRFLERVFTDAEYLALPSTIPSGPYTPIRADVQLTTSFSGTTKQTRLVPGTIEVEVEHDRLMKAIDTVFDTCPTRPLTPIEDE